jgi:hypothetical protein
MAEMIRGAEIYSCLALDTAKLEEILFWIA